ncbi:MAG: dihydropteroate synthase [Ferruginibacter sp.]
MYSINCRGKIYSLSSPLVMGIINATPDSFYEGHLEKTKDEILMLADKMIIDGADILDIGGQSSRPGSKLIDAAEELLRVIPVIKMIRNAYPDILISVDSFFSKVAMAAVDAGADIVNDISAGNIDEDMIPAVARLNVPYICMHMKGSPQTMQEHTNYINMLPEILDYFISKISICRDAGIKDIIIDPGFGFSKTIEQNFILLRSLSIFKSLGLPLLTGLSRKSSIYKTLDIDVKDALNGTTVLNTIALQNGADILRVHDVKEAKQAIRLFTKYQS